MAATTAETVHEAKARIGQHLSEAYRKASQFSQDARGLPTLAREAMESGKEAAHEAAGHGDRAEPHDRRVPAGGTRETPQAS